jgi:hypothetical protein
MFKAPIELLDQTKVKTVSDNCANDLQLKEVYNDLFEKTSSDSNSLTHLRKTWLSTFTTDTSYLKETQSLLSQNKITLSTVNTEPIRAIINELKTNPSFREKYEYITVDYFEHLNKTSHFTLFSNITYNFSHNTIYHVDYSLFYSECARHLYKFFNLHHAT